MYRAIEFCMPLVSFGAALVVLGWLVRSRLARFALDHPNRRSLHHAPTPRVGGIGVLVGVALALATVGADTVPVLGAGLALLATVSLADDMRSIGVAARLTTHLVAAGLLAAAVVYTQMGLAPTIVVALGVAWMINLYNFMDGSDGLAGGMALFGFSFYGLAAWLGGHEAYALLNLSIAASAAAFLCFNFHPARIFLGDIGAVPLGYLAAALGLIGWNRELWPLWFPLLVFSPFIVDASLTLARRAARRERVWEAHFDHYYQRLIRMGWGHRRTALIEYALMLLSGLAALAALAAGTAAQALLFATAVLVYAALAVAVDRAWFRFHARQHA
jgi:UDP-N-acetylmuramyl pentapeptide phosphotransferase/UDP-N-acetylglucosamine-1-phosphate transferase